jgi:hypothetical protein
VQECRRRGYYNIGFMDPDIINENSVIKWPNRAENNIFMTLDGRILVHLLCCRTTSSKPFDSFFHAFNLIISISNISYVYVYQKL